MISWKYRDSQGNDHYGRDQWRMERKGRLSPADIIRMEYDLAKKWGYPNAVLILNVVELT